LGLEEFAFEIAFVRGGDLAYLEASACGIWHVSTTFSEKSDSLSF
jgi:uncharacterized cupin superfamily protein